ncbi:alpha-2B adrenergic receptor-like [Saccostrea echinata]|uniref:alpha-2B adrenergic receptor-like n=1 Tax=Saccostrea echinata TaxID=191078 RepID=UPI002A7EC099|nr:alpha-2B adrenergic receptor-like [Saccostrea echinata]
MMIFLITCTFTIFGNLFLVFKVARRRQFDRKIKVFVISLALADLFIDIMFSTSSILHFTCMNIDRFVAVSKPLKYFQIMNRRLVTCMVFLCWFIAFSNSVFVLYMNANKTICRPHYNLSVEGSASLIGSVLVFYLPLMLNISGSINIYLRVRTRSQQLCHLAANEGLFLDHNQQRSETRVTKH